MFSKNIAITDTTDGLPNPRRIWAVIAASLALIMSVLDANIVNVVLPTLSREFGTSPSTTIWVMNAYQLAITVSLLSFSSPGDIYGYHKVFLSGVAVFCVTSLICVLSTSFWMMAPLFVTLKEKAGEQFLLMKVLLDLQMLQPQLLLYDLE